MARPLRIEFKGALYHIISRGNERRGIFLGDDDYKVFLGVLEEMTDRIFQKDVQDRDVLLYFFRETGLYTNKQIGELFGLTYSPVSRRASIVKSQISKQSEMRRKYSRIKSIIKVWTHSLKSLLDLKR